MKNKILIIIIAIAIFFYSCPTFTDKERSKRLDDTVEIIVDEEQ